MNSDRGLKKYFSVILCIYVFVLVQSGCDFGHQTSSVNKGVYKVVEEKWDKDFGSRLDYKIDFDDKASGDLKIEDLIGESGVLGLSDAVAFATGHSSLYQKEKELFYLQSLDMILAHCHLFAFPGKSGAGLVTKVNGQSVAGKISTTAELAEAWSAVLTDALRKGTTSVLDVPLAEPLKKRMERDSNVIESQRQLERDAMYQVRSFNHFRKKFELWITSGYYRVLQGNDAVKAALKNHKALEEACEKLKKLVGVGRIQKCDLDRAYHEKLQAWEKYLRTKHNYEELLDNFKLELGVPMRMEIRLDEKELDILRKSGVSEAAFPLDKAIENVLENRLDLANQADALTDRLRKIFRTAYNPNVSLDFIDHSRKVSDGQFEHGTLEYLEKQFDLEFDEELPFDLLREHNEFRKDMMALSVLHREYAEKVDKIIADVRDAYTDLEEATECYRLQLQIIELAEKRVNESFTLLSSGRGNVGNVLRAHDDLNEAHIGATDALVDSAIAVMKIQVRQDAMWRKWIWR